MQESSERVRAEGGEWGPGSGPMSQLGAEVTGPAMIQLREVRQAWGSDVPAYDSAYPEIAKRSALEGTLTFLIAPFLIVLLEPAWVLLCCCCC